MGAHEVTREEYARWLEEVTKGGAVHGGCSPKEPKDKSHAPLGWDPAVALAMRDRRPATGVDYWDAVACAKGLGGRLPGVDELKAAATGPSERSRPWGEHAFDPALANLAGAYEKQLLPGGSLYGGASPFGVFDVLGNAEEWCAPESEGDKAPVFGGDAGGDKDLDLTKDPVAAPLDERQPLRGFRVVIDLE
jgi:formylglycine-generating enzyme required for sulfatase activity